MKYIRREVWETSEPKEKEQQTPRRGPQPVDIFGFDKIRENCCGEWPGMPLRDVWDYSTIRMNLWGR